MLTGCPTQLRWLAALLAGVLQACSPGASGGNVGGEVPAGWTEEVPLPVPVTNNAVTAVWAGGQQLIFSFSGLDTTRQYDGIHARAFRYDMNAGAWAEVNSPGTPRLAATAETVRGRVYLFGGYTVGSDAGEKTLPAVDVYDPLNDTWSQGAPMPVPADDAVSGVWRDSLIFLISGWHDRDNISNVQIYDPFAENWRQATPIPGAPVFGHAGAIAGDAIVYIDGVRTAPESPRFRMSAASYVGLIDPDDPSRIDWRKLPSHPGPPLYRAAAGALDEWIFFAGGTDNPYNYDGIGYDGEPSSARAGFFAYDVTLGDWVVLDAKPLPSMDHRGLVVVGRALFIVGGMLEGQRVTSRVQRYGVER